MNKERSNIEGWHKVLNHPDLLPEKAFRRNASIYELVSYVNNIIGCYSSENFGPIPLFIERARSHMSENPNEHEQYYSKVEGYLKDLKVFLGTKASVTNINSGKHEN